MLKSILLISRSCLMFSETTVYTKLQAFLWKALQFLAGMYMHWWDMNFLITAGSGCLRASCVANFFLKTNLSLYLTNGVGSVMYIIRAGMLF